MLQEISAEGFSYDAPTDTARVKAPGASGTGRRGLFDAKGFLVGIDLRGEDLKGTVVMIGPHEAVAETRDLRASVDVEGVLISDAHASVRAHEKNPYA